MPPHFIYLEAVHYTVVQSFTIGNISLFEIKANTSRTYNVFPTPQWITLYNSSGAHTWLEDHSFEHLDRISQRGYFSLSQHGLDLAHK